MTAKDFVADMVHIYELNKTREALPLVEADIQELQELTRRIGAIFVNLVERIKIEADLKEKQWNSLLAEKEAELEKCKTRVQELLNTLQELEEEKKALIAAKQEIEKDLERRLSDAMEINNTLKSLIKEYEEKNSGLQAEVKKLTIYADENDRLQKELTRKAEENERLAARIKEVTGQLEHLKHEKEIEIEKAKLEKDRAVLEVRNEYEKR